MNILFFEKSQIKWVLDLEKKLKIDFEFSNQIDDIDTSGSDDDFAFGSFVQHLDKKVQNKQHRQRTMKVDKKASK